MPSGRSCTSLPDGPSGARVTEPRWFEVTGLRIRRTARLRDPGYLNLVDATEARAELDGCIAALASKLDVKPPPTETCSGD